MKCELCNKKSNIIYATRKYGLICGECERKINNDKKGKLKKKEEMLKMYRKYGLDV